MKCLPFIVGLIAAVLLAIDDACNSGWWQKKNDEKKSVLNNLEDAEKFRDKKLPAPPPGKQRPLAVPTVEKENQGTDNKDVNAPSDKIPSLVGSIEEAGDDELKPLAAWMWENDKRFTITNDETQVETDSESNVMPKDRDEKLVLFPNKNKDKENLDRLPSYVAMRNIFSVVGHIDDTKREKFFRSIEETKPYKLLKQVLLDKKSVNDAEKYLKELWFGEFQALESTILYTSFRLVFVGVFNGNKVFGLNHWFRIWSLEDNNELQYARLAGKQHPPPSSGLYIAKIKFKYGHSTSETERSIMFYTSPEFDFVLFTLSHLAKPDGGTTNFYINDCDGIAVTTSSLTYGHKRTKYITDVSVAPLKRESDECSGSETKS